MALGQELLRRFEAGRIYTRLEITGRGFMLGAETVLAGMRQNARGRPRLALDDEQRVLALLSTAYGRPVEAHVLTKLRRAAELWNDGEKALAHIHLAYVGLPPCDEEQALRLFVAEELIEAGVTPAALTKAQGFDPAPLDLLKANFNQAQPRWPAGSGRDCGRWSGGASGDSAGVKELIARLLLEAARRAVRSLRPSETKPPNPEVVKPESKPPETPEDEQLPNVDANKLHHIFEKPGRNLESLISDFGSQEAAFEAIEKATREVVLGKGISGPYETQITVGQYQLQFGEMS